MGPVVSQPPDTNPLMNPGMKPLADVLETLVEKLTAQHAASRSSLTIMADWDSLVPPIWKEHGTPVRIQGTELVVAVLDGPSASLLRFRVGELMDAINQAFSTTEVTAVRVIVGRTQ